MTNFGNMTGGGGLTAIVDGNPATTGYARGTVGFFGVSFDTPKALKSVKVTSASNGFDASGLETQIELTLFGKQGDAPKSADDGVPLARIAFKDVNTITTKTLTTEDATAYSHVWVTCRTQEWAVFAEVNFATRDTTPARPIFLVPESRSILRGCVKSDLHFPQGSLTIEDFGLVFEIKEAERIAQIDFHADVKHVGTAATYLGVVGVGFRFERRQAASAAELSSAPWLSMEGMVGGFNIIDRDPHHYGNKSICGAFRFEKGFHEIRVWGSAHTTGSNLDGLAAIYPEYNTVRYVFEPVAAQLFDLKDI